MGLRVLSTLVVTVTIHQNKETRSEFQQVTVSLLFLKDKSQAKISMRTRQEDHFTTKRCLRRLQRITANR